MLDKTFLSFFFQGLKRKPKVDRLHGSIEKPINPDLKLLLPYFKKYWKKMLLGFVAVLIFTLLGLLLPLVNKELIDKVIIDKQHYLLIPVAGVFVLISLLALMTGAFQNFYFTKIEQMVLIDIQKDVFDRTIRLPKTFFDEQETGYLISRISNDLSGLRWFFSSTMVQIIANFIKLVGSACLLIYLKWQLALAVIILFPLLYVITKYFGKRMRMLSRQSSEQWANVNRQVQESITSASHIKAFATEKHESSRLMNELTESRQINLEQAAVGSVSSLLISGVADISKLFVLIAGAYLIFRGELTLGGLLAFQMYLLQLYNPAQFLAFASIQLQNALASLERISAMFKLTPEDTENGKTKLNLDGSIEFKNVGFSYQKEQTVLENINFKIEKGEHVAIVGTSGAGKTTLISLILQFYQPCEGGIFIDNVCSCEYKLSWLRERIGYVSQNTTLLTGSILENLKYGNSNSTIDEVIDAAKVAGIHDFISALPEGYQTKTSEKGNNFSEGQKQRLSIARALIKKPDILLLDEPTSALDAITERSIMDELPQAILNKTLILISHKESTLQKCSKIILIHNNTLAAIGAHHELMQNNALYKELFIKS